MYPPSGHNHYTIVTMLLTLCTDNALIVSGHIAYTLVTIRKRNLFVPQKPIKPAKHRQISQLTTRINSAAYERLKTLGSKKLRSRILDFLRDPHELREVLVPDFIEREGKKPSDYFLYRARICCSPEFRKKVIEYAEANGMSVSEFICRFLNYTRV